MKRIRDCVAGLDEYRVTVVACGRVVGPDGEIEVTKASFATTRKGLGELECIVGDGQFFERNLSLVNRSNVGKSNLITLTICWNPTTVASSNPNVTSS